MDKAEIPCAIVLQTSVNLQHETMGLASRLLQAEFYLLCWGELFAMYF